MSVRVCYGVTRRLGERKNKPGGMVGRRAVIWSVREPVTMSAAESVGHPLFGKFGRS